MASDSRVKILREGERYVQQGKISLAINEYLKILKTDPEDVLTLNIVGDLFLRQGKTSDANRLFLQVAEHYTHNNFLLKAIAVYKKILNNDSHNLEVNLLLASLYARQGMNVDARNQYILVADLCAQEGKNKESLEAFEKVVEIDPVNAPIQLKLAEAYLWQGLKDKAHLCFLNAARAQLKSGDVKIALASFRRALELNPASSEALRGFLETALQAGDIAQVLDQLKDSLDNTPDDPAVQELLGRAYLASGNLEWAGHYFELLIASDESRCDHFFPLSKAFLEAGDPDRALECLDKIVTIVIGRRQTDKLVEAYNLILAANSGHVATLKKLAEIYSAINDTQRNIATLERIAQHYQDSNCPAEALEALEKILEIIPTSEKHLKKHREAFEQAFASTPYVLPRAVFEAAEHDTPHHLETAAGTPAARASGDDSSHATLVEIDLLLNYGMKDKALQLLRTLEVKTPLDTGMRQRLASLYRETGEENLAAEQCVLLSALQQKAGDMEEAQKSLQEAETLAPDWVKGLDVTAFAQKHGISLEQLKTEGGLKGLTGNLEVDLSGDLSEIFFKEAPGSPELEESSPAGAPDAIIDEYPQDIPATPAPESIEEQLQEVDFYIRLGFQDEARTKLDEIAEVCPDHPELTSRYSQLGIESSKASDSIPLAPPVPPILAPAAPEQESCPPVPLLARSAAEAAPSPVGSDLPGGNLEAAAGQFGENRWLDLHDEQLAEMPPLEHDSAVPAGAASVDAAPAAPEAAAEAPDNSMFADLIAEVNSLTDQEIAQEDFETHFSLGTAFREMGLTEDAIKEFQGAVKALNPAKSPKEVIQCCGMLSTCFLEKGMPRSAIRWCQTALNIKEISSHEAMALRYDMGVAHAASGDSKQALECFGEVFGIDPSYRDVAQRIDDLKSGLERHDP